MSNLMLLDLPVDILIHIFKYLSIPDLRNVMICSKTFHNVLNADNVLWKYVTRHKLVINKTCTTNSKINYSPLSWYNKCRISHNWITGIYRSKIVLHHRERYMPWLQYINKFLILSLGSELRCYSVSNKGFLQNRDILWSLEVPKVLRRDVRTNDISRFILNNNHLVCGNRDGCVALYEFKNNNLHQKPRLLHHIQDCHQNGTVEVSSVELVNKSPTHLVISASYNDPDLKFWRSEPNQKNTGLNMAIEELRRLQIPDCSGFKCISLDSGQSKLAIGVHGMQAGIIIMDIETGRCVHKSGLSSSKNRNHIRDIRWHDANVATYVTHSGRLQSFDNRSGAVVHDTVDPFRSTLYCVRTDGDHAIVAGSSEYSRCVLYDNRCKHHTQMYFTQKKCSPIYCLDFDSTKLIAAADISVAMLNFNVNIANAQIKDYSHVFECVEESS